MAIEEGREFIPAFFVDVVQKGEVFPAGGDNWPLHMTLFPPIEEPYYPYYGEVLRSVINTMAPFEVVVGEDGLFGPNFDVPVKRIEESPKLRLVHQGIVRTLSQLRHDPTYRQPYNPHVSIQPGKTIETGEKIYVGGFSIVEKSVTPDGKIWTVVDKIGMKGLEIAEHETAS